ncbi:hypothetical protein SFRURICE_002470, partial [Spodoptera frugiperda]
MVSMESLKRQRLVREAIEITKYKNFNREDGFQLSRAWNPVVQLCKTRKTAKKEESSRADTSHVIGDDAYCHVLGTVTDSVLLLRNFRKTELSP